MAYITRTDLQTHLYPEIITEIVRDKEQHFANLAAFPVTGLPGVYYVADDDSKSYIWNGTQYIETAAYDIVGKAIQSAIDEAKSYMGNYDLVAIFGTDDTAPTYADENLKNKVKDIAIWHLLKLCNPNINLEFFRTVYEDALKWFDKVINGKLNGNWPAPVDDPETPENEAPGQVSWDSNPKRSNHY